MTLYDLIRGVSEVLTPETNSLFEYIINSSDDNGGFLRTCWCKKSKLLRDFEIKDRRKVLVCFREPFKENCEYYGKDDFSDTTRVKLQLFYRCDGLEEDMEWSTDMGYFYAYTIDLENKTFEYVDNNYLW